MGTLVWAVSVSGLAAYFYFENTTLSRQIAENQLAVDEMTSTYDGLMAKYNLLQREYSPLYGSYSFPGDTDFAQPMKPLGNLIDGLEENFTSLLVDQEDLERAYRALQEDYQGVYVKGEEVSGEDFGRLLNGFYELLNLLTLRELSVAVSESITVTVNIGIDYGNGTVGWHNGTEVPAGTSLFQLTRDVADVGEDDYDYYPWMRPGHVMVNSINDAAAFSAADFSEGWSWIWYYWDDSEQDWVSGIVGCDAWIVENGGTYKWQFEHWSFL